MRKTPLVISFIFVFFLSFVLVFFPSFDSAKAPDVGVFIQADGAVYGTGNIRRNGDMYTFVENVSGPLYIQRDDIIVDGAGYTLVGGNGRGIVLAGRRGVTVKNIRVMLDGGYVIDLEDAADCALIGNTLIGTPQPIPGLPPPASPLIGPIGINFLHSQNITIKDNTITNFFKALSLEWSNGHTIIGNKMVDGIVGIDLWNSTGCVFRNNSMINSGFSIRVYFLYQYENDLDSSNTIDGRPIYYWIDFKDKKVSPDAAYIVLVRCTNITVENVSPQGIVLVSTTNSIIRKVKMTGRGDGIKLLDCSGISILNSVLRDHAIGIDLENSFNNTIKGNEISNHTTCGISLGKANNNLISSNIFAVNSYAVAAFQDEISHGNILTLNNFTKNDFALTVQGNMKILSNIFENNNVAILLESSSGTNITQNTFTENKNALYISAASNNSIYLNNFLNNDHQVTDAGVNNLQMSMQPVKLSSSSTFILQLVAAHVREINFLPPPPPSINSWDNGSKGNYWIGYDGSDADGDCIGDTPYYLYENNQDNYPLMNPVTDFEVPSTIVESSSPVEVPSQPPENTAPPEDTQETRLQIQQIVAAILMLIVGLTITWAFFTKGKNHKHGNQS